MNTIVARSISRSPTAALHAGLWGRVRFALRRFGALYAQARIRQAANEIQRFEERHR